MTVNTINKDYRLRLRVLTPLHVGGMQEKHLLAGADFVYQNRRVHRLDEAKLLTKVNPYELADCLLQPTNRNLENFLRRQGIRLADVTLGEPLPIEIEPQNEIKAFVRSGSDGKPYVPGSSLKGALRSVVFGALNTSKKSSETLLLGGFDNSIFRHIKVGDAFFDRLELYPAKTFNLRGETPNWRGETPNWRGGWRHKDRTNDTFSPNGSVFVYECLPPGTTGELTLRILDAQSKLYKKLLEWSDKELEKKRKNGKGNPLPRDFEKIIGNTDPLGWLFQTINERTRRFLAKEIAFFKKYKVAETKAILQPLVQMQQWLDEIPDTDACILRMAHGSGFHSITGDWKYDEYTNDDDTWQNGKKRYKSRKLLFRGDAFFPMGFVLLARPETDIDALNMATNTAIVAEATADSAPPPAATFFTGKIREGATGLDAIVTQSGKPSQIEVYLQEPETVSLPLISYNHPLKVGTIIQVRIIRMDKRTGKPLEIRFHKFKK